LLGIPLPLGTPVPKREEELPVPAADGEVKLPVPRDALVKGYGALLELSPEDIPSGWLDVPNTTLVVLERGAESDDVMPAVPEDWLDPETEAAAVGDEITPVRDGVLVIPIPPLIGAEPGIDVVSPGPATVVVFVKGYGAEDTLPPNSDDVRPLLGDGLPVIDELTGEDGVALPGWAGLLVGYDEVEVEDGPEAVIETLPLVPTALVGAIPRLVVVAWVELLIG
jgi:hypothetical protein